MNIEKIEINGHYVWVDIHNKDFEKGRFGLYKKYKIGVITDVNDDILEFEGEYIDEEHCYKIIAASPELNLEGVPTYVEWLADNYGEEVKEQYIDSKLTFDERVYLYGGAIEGFKKGYQTAEKELQKEINTLKKDSKAIIGLGKETIKSIYRDNPTWDDVKKAIEMARPQYDDNGYTVSDYTEKEIIEQLKQSKQ